MSGRRNHDDTHYPSCRTLRGHRLHVGVSRHVSVGEVDRSADIGVVRIMSITDWATKAAEEIKNILTLDFKNDYADDGYRTAVDFGCVQWKEKG